MPQDRARPFVRIVWSHRQGFLLLISSLKPAISTPLEAVGIQRLYPGRGRRRIPAPTKSAAVHPHTADALQTRADHNAWLYLSPPAYRDQIRRLPPAGPHK